MGDVIWNEWVAASYDAASADMFDPAVLQPTVDFLAEAAGGGATLELGIGTGRVALPLSQRGVEVHGIDSSIAMAAQLAAEPGGDRISFVLGDIASTQVGRTFGLVYAPYNVVTNLLTQEAQVACIRNTAAHLQPGGRFVAEVFVPSSSASRRVRPSGRSR